MTGDVDWHHLRSEFGRMRETLTSVRLVGQEDYDQLRRSILTYGLLKAPGWLEVQYGAAFYIHPSPGSFTRDLWIWIATELKQPLSADLEFPEHIRRARRDQVDHMAVVGAALEREAMSDAFLRSWSRLNYLCGQLRVLTTLPDANGALTRQALAGLDDSTEVQKCWYAHWIVRHAPSLAPEDRTDAAFALADLCRGIVNKTIEPWPPYPRNWFEKVLSTDRKDVSGPLEKLGAPALRKLVRDPHYTLDVLPPLSPAAFGRHR